MPGADIRHDMGAAEPARSPALTGSWAPDLDVDAGVRPVRVAELTRNARPLLLDLTEEASLVPEIRPWSGRVDAVGARLASAAGANVMDGATATLGRIATVTAASTTAMPLRPDCCPVRASSSPRPGAGERAELRAAMARWFGPGTSALSRAGATGR